MKRIIGLVSIALIALTGLTGCSESLDEDEALASCQVQVSKKLKDPSSASYDGGAESVVLVSENSYSVSGTGRACEALTQAIEYAEADTDARTKARNIHHLAVTVVIELGRNRHEAAIAQLITALAA